MLYALWDYYELTDLHLFAVFQCMAVNVLIDRGSLSWALAMWPGGLRAVLLPAAEDPRSPCTASGRPWTSATSAGSRVTEAGLAAGTAQHRRPESPTAGPCEEAESRRTRLLGAFLKAQK